MPLLQHFRSCLALFSEQAHHAEERNLRTFQCAVSTGSLASELLTHQNRPQVPQ
jgi:hypothetical protein